MKLTFKEACEAVADLFEAVPGLWTSWAAARDSHNDKVLPLDPTACKWCAWGGLVAALGGMSAVEQNESKLKSTIKLLYLGFEYLEDVNDYLGRKAAIRVLREAAK